MTPRDDAALEVRTEPLASGGLAALVERGTAPGEWYERAPAGADAWRDRLAAVRATAAHWHEALAPAFAASGAAAARLARSADGRGALVTTGQQPGLFGGPIYTWSKALSALALADELERATGVPVAPVFWAATDDADFAEASETFVAAGDRVERLAMAPPAEPGAPLAEVPLGDVSRQLDSLALGAGSAAFADALGAARAAYGAGETVGSAYLRLLRALLEPLGIAVLDASHPAVLAAARPTIGRALSNATEVQGALAAREQGLAEAGHRAQVASVPGLSLVFARDGREKRRVAIAHASDAGADASGTLSPNVLLRPVVERAVLPTAAYVAGPGEIAYFAQVSAVADAIGAERPLVVPRWSGTIVEPHVRRALARLGVSLDDVRSPHALESRLARAAMPDDAVRSIEALRAAAAALADGGLVPGAVTDGARAQIALRIERYERRLAAAVKRQGTEALRDLRTARASLFPNDARQERTLNFLPLLARYGPALIAAMRARADERMRELVAGRTTP